MAGLRLGRGLHAAGAHWSANVDTVVQMVAKTAPPGDSILVMSNGGFGGIHQKLLDRLD